MTSRDYWMSCNTLFAYTSLQNMVEYSDESTVGKNWSKSIRIFIRQNENKPEKNLQERKWMIFDFIFSFYFSVRIYSYLYE